MQERYKKNIGFLTEPLLYDLLSKTIAVLGVGGQGGYIVEYLARLGVKKIIIFDPDTFEESNLNRQRFCNMNSLGASKAESSAKQALEINPTIQIEYYSEACGEQHWPILQTCNFIFACADNGVNGEENRRVLRRCLLNHIPIIDVATTGFGYQIHCNCNDVQAWDGMSEAYCRKKWTKETRPNLSTPAYLCSMGSSLAVNYMVEYFRQPLASFNKHVEYHINRNQLIVLPL